MKPPEKFETERLILRRPRIEDAPILFVEYMQDTEVTRYVMWRLHTNVDQTLEFLKGCISAWDDGRRFPYVITFKEVDKPVGMVDFHINGLQAGIGYVIARAYWGQGYMSEAVRVIVKWALSQPSIYRVCADCDVENKASARVTEKVGMQREGIMRRYIIHPNVSTEPRDCYLYAIVR